jgi:hypothetical protein
MPEKRIIFGSLVVLALLGGGAFLLANSFAPVEEKNVLLNDSFSVPGNKYENRTVWIDSSGDYVASFTVSEGTINSSRMDPGTMSLWLEGKFKPDWFVSDQGDYEMVFGPMQEALPISFVFVNNDASTKEVHLEVSKVWKETNYVGLLGGAALILSGTILGVMLKYRHKAPLSLCL